MSRWLMLARVPRHGVDHTACRRFKCDGKPQAAGLAFVHEAGLGNTCGVLGSRKIEALAGVDGVDFDAVGKPDAGHVRRRRFDGIVRLGRLGGRPERPVADCVITKRGAYWKKTKESHE